MRMKVIVLAGFAYLFGLLSAQQGLAAIYKYIDKNGVITFADDLQVVPEEYRASVKIVSGEETEKKPSHPAQGKQPEGPAGSVTRDMPSAASGQKTADVPGGSGLFGGKALVSVVVVVSGGFLLALLGTFDADHKKAVKAVRLTVLWGVTVYLLVAHAGDAVRFVKKISGGIDASRQESEEKGKKAARAVKAWSELTGPAEQPHVEGAGRE